MKIKKDSKYFGLQPEAAGIGQVIGSREEEVGWAYVLFHNGYKNRYRTGLPLVQDGACDLELAEESLHHRDTISASDRDEELSRILRERAVRATRAGKQKLASES